MLAHSDRLGWFGAGGCRESPGFDSQPGPEMLVLQGCTGLLAARQQELPPLSSGDKFLKSHRDWGFGHVALVLLYFRKHLFSETLCSTGAAAHLPEEDFEVQAGLVQGQGSFCPA